MTNLTSQRSCGHYGWPTQTAAARHIGELRCQNKSWFKIWGEDRPCVWCFSHPACEPPWAMAKGFKWRPSKHLEEVQQICSWKYIRNWGASAGLKGTCTKRTKPVVQQVSPSVIPIVLPCWAAFFDIWESTPAGHSCSFNFLYSL